MRVPFFRLLDSLLHQLFSLFQLQREIYDHEELGTKLKNHNFRTGSDCEVIAYLVSIHGSFDMPITNLTSQSRPNAGMVPGGTNVGPGGLQNQVRPLVNMGTVPGAGRGFGFPGKFGRGSELTLLSHRLLSSANEGANDA
ncbi:hypothetical protein C5167_035227 [Papaver somniferum]|uniref:Uncharacterized protein n=1 Tax=Papaver somniferum TaxID=3469 RepID=A0A4Y7KI70_PAPSO|nr:hypothetical protein C5167_035227 [Papaver somniferum]